MKSAPTGASADEAYTLDAFHRGRFHLVQPAKGAHRAGADAMLVAAAVPSGFAGRLADLGAGAGAVGLAVLSRCPDARATLVERSPEMARCARLTLGRAENAPLSARVELIVADAGAAGEARRTSGLEDRSFDFVAFNPPFNAPHDRRSPHAEREAAHVMDDDLIAAWMRSAAAILKPGGSVAVIVRPGALPELLDAARGRFGAAMLRAVHPSPARPAIRIVFRAKAGRAAGISLVPPLFMRTGDGRAPSAEAEAIANGRATLFGD